MLNAKLFAAAVLFLSPALASARSRRAEIDYAPSIAPEKRQPLSSLPINPEGINVVSGNVGSHEAGFTNAFMNHRHSGRTLKRRDAVSRSKRLNYFEREIGYVDFEQNGTDQTRGLANPHENQ